MKPPLPLFETLSEWGTLAPGLARVQAALQALQQPHRRFPHILVGGTNGKGSVCAMTAASLPGKVGLFLSPHVHDIRERICIDGAPVPDSAWQAAYAQVRARAAREATALSYFEWLVVLACLIFAEAEVDMAVMEVGLGGRDDATNALNPLLSVVTSVGLDHQALLGETREAIACQKLGIGRPGKPLLIPQDVLGYDRVRDFLTEHELTAQPFESKGFEDGNFELVARILKALGHEGPVRPSTLPGRRESYKIGKGLYIDGAHNEHAWRDLLRWYKKRHGNEKCHMVVTMTQGRDPARLLEVFAEVCAGVYVFRAGYARELPADAWPSHAVPLTAVHPSLFTRPVLVCGSLYMVGPFHALLRAGGISL